jgi:peptidoglycan-N-acetylglucosamine deacetylase
MLPVSSLLFVLAAGSAHVMRARTSSNLEVWAFTGPWDAASDSSLRRHGQALDVAVTGWIALDSATLEPTLPSAYPDAFSPSASSPRRFAIVTSWHGSRFHPSSIHSLAADPARLRRVATSISASAHAAGYRGLVLDFEDETPRDLADVVAVAKAVTAAAHANHVSTVALAVPAADTIRYPTRPLADATDLLLPMLYDEHWSESKPGAIAEPSWVRRVLAERVHVAGVDRIVAGLPTYSYHWKPGKPGEQISYDEAQLVVQRAKARLSRDPSSETLRTTIARDGEVWATDAELLRRLFDVVRASGVRRVAMWRLGQEDPAIWRTLMSK